MGESESGGEGEDEGANKRVSRGTAKELTNDQKKEKKTKEKNTPSTEGRERATRGGGKRVVARHWHLAITAPLPLSVFSFSHGYLAPTVVIAVFMAVVVPPAVPE